MDIKMIENLTKILKEELKIYKNMLTITANKTKIIVERKTNELEEITKKEQEFIIKIGKLEELREKIVYSLSRSLDIGYNSMSLKEILSKIENDEVKTEIMECQNSILTTIDELKNQNDLNEQLIKNAIEYVNFSINLMSSINDGTNNYGKSGSVRDTEKRKYFDTKR